MKTKEEKEIKKKMLELLHLMKTKGIIGKNANIGNYYMMVSFRPKEDLWKEKESFKKS